jgi:hypothetical protein
MENEIAGIFETLNEKGKWIALQQAKALQGAYSKEQEEPASLTRTGDFRGLKWEGNIIYPEWG